MNKDEVEYGGYYFMKVLWLLLSSWVFNLIVMARHLLRWKKQSTQNFGMVGSREAATMKNRTETDIILISMFFWQK
jgi:hypothetical protein